MKNIPDIPIDKYLHRFLLILTLFFILLRFVNLDADFPQGITSSAALYTDEGWYSSAAINLILNGEWYIDGDPNLVVNQPVGHIIQFIMFSIFGMSLSTARLTIVLFFILLLVFTYLLTFRFSNKMIAVYACMFLSINTILFAYSRLAILEIMMLSFAVLSLLIVTSWRQKSIFAAAGLGSIILAVAHLTKNTAVFALPLLMFLAGARGREIKTKIILALFSGLIFTVLVSGYNYLAASAYPEDYALFQEGNFTSRMSFALSDILENSMDVVFEQAKIIEPVIYPLSLILSPIVFFCVKKSANRTLIILSLLWIISYFGILSLTSYHPTRYFLPLAIPIGVLFSAEIYFLREKVPNFISISIQLVFMAYLLFSNGGRIIECIQNPEFTFVNMARDVKEIIMERCQCDGKDQILIGPPSNTVGMEIGISSIHPSGTRPLEWKLETYKPRFYISLGNEGGDVEKISEEYTMIQLSEWDVFHNYSRNRKVYLYEIDMSKE